MDMKQNNQLSHPQEKSRSFLVNFILFLGFLFVVSAVAVFLSGYANFQTQWDQTEWTAVVAQVVDVTATETDHATVYEVEYQYEADGATYTGTTQRSADDLDAGDSLTVKYDPEQPETSTANLVVDMAFLIQTSVFAVLAVICLYGPSLYKKKKQGVSARRLPLR